MAYQTQRSAHRRQSPNHTAPKLPPSQTPAASAPSRSPLLRVLCDLCVKKNLSLQPRSQRQIRCFSSRLYLLTSLRPYFNFSKSIFDSQTSFDFICSSHVTSLPVYAAVRAIMHETADSAPVAA